MSYRGKRHPRLQVDSHWAAGALGPLAHAAAVGSRLNDWVRAGIGIRKIQFGWRGK